MTLTGYLPNRCFAILEQPDARVGQPDARAGQPDAVRGCAILVPPFAEEKKAAQRALVETARAMAEAGWATLRFDLSGTGDSPGEHGEATLADWLDEIRDAIASMRHTQPGVPLALIGLRLGATLAWLAAADGHVDQLVLWEPVTSGAAYMRQNRQRSQIRREMTDGEGPAQAATDALGPFDFDGFAISARLHRELAETELASTPVPEVASAQILQISGSARLKKPLEDLRTRLLTGGVPAVSLEAVQVEAFWSAIGLVDTTPVRAATVGWLQPAAAAATPTTALLEPSCGFDGLTVDALSFQSGDQACHGVLYRPSAGPVARAVLLLHGWSGYRVGPGALLSQAARELAGEGYAVYSFDFRGRGDSEWEVAEASLNSMIRDTARAIPIVCDKTGATHVTLLGLCSGGEVAIGASLSDPRVDSLALWSAPIFSGNFDFARRARRSQQMVRDYWRKLMLKETWTKLFSGRLNWRLIGRAVAGGRSNEDAAVEDKAPDTASQMQAFEAFRGRLLFIYGGNDPETAPSREFYRSFVERVGLAHTFYEVAGANHNYYARGWHREVLDTTRAWLSEGTP